MREVASVRITGSLPMSPVPLSVSMLQMAISSVAGTTNCRSTQGEQRGVAPHQHFGALDAGRGDAGGGVALETLLEGAVLAAVERQRRQIQRDARGRAL